MKMANVERQVCDRAYNKFWDQVSEVSNTVWDQIDDLVDSQIVDHLVWLIEGEQNGTSLATI